MHVIHVIYVYHWLFYNLMSVSKIKVSCYTSLYPFFFILFINLKPLKNINMSVSVLDCLQKHQHKSFLLLISTRCLIKLYGFLYMITDSNTSGHRCHKHYQIFSTRSSTQILNEKDIYLSSVLRFESEF